MRPAMLLVTLALVAGCGSKLKRLSSAERDHFHALEVYLDADDEKAFLKLKTEAERDAWLQGHGPSAGQSFWDLFYQYDEAERDAIAAGEVARGWTEDRVFMAWGRPFERRRLTGRPATRSELFVYRFEVDRDGIIRVWVPDSRTAYKAVRQYQMDVYVDDGRVTELERKDRWE